MLEPDPVLEDAMVVAEVQAARGAHAGEDAFLIHVLVLLQVWSWKIVAMMTVTMPPSRAEECCQGYR